MNILQQLREEGRYNEAIDTFIKVCRSTKPDFIEAGPAVLRECLFGERCLVLEWATDEIAQGRRQQCGDRLKTLRETVTPLMGDSAQLFVARLGLIQTVMLDTGETDTDAKAADAADDELETAIVNLLCEVQRRWNYQRHQDVQVAEETEFVAAPARPLNGPSFLAHLSSDRHRTVFHNLAAVYGWLHPGLLLAGETIAALEGYHERADHKVTNWIMFAAKLVGRSEGILARLTIERIPAGDCRGGMLVPDPLSSGYLLMEESFSTGLQHAWLATRKFGCSAREYDWRWRIEIEEATRDTAFQNLLTVPMEGRSAEGALTCAMLTAGNGEELDANTVMSACLELKGGHVTGSLKLAPVVGLDVKTMADRLRLADRLRVKKIRDIIVSRHQKDIDLATGSGHHFLKTCDITTALTHFCTWHRIARAVRANIFQAATLERAALCGPPIPEDQQLEKGVDFVQPPIGLRDLDRQAVDGGLRANPQPLSDDELQQFVLGHWRPSQLIDDAPVRLQLFADSGMGKTVQLLICEQAIASDDTLRIPVRIGRRAAINERQVRLAREERSLDSIQWCGPLDGNLRQLAELLQHHVPDDYKEQTDAWVRRLAKQGQFVFLLDALDQQRHQLTHLATFLSKDEICQCPAIVAGRPESLTSRGEVFAVQNWHRLEILKLPKTHQERCLGTELAGVLIPRHDTLEVWSSESEQRRHQWKDLLETPLLLILMKQLAMIDTDGQRPLDGIRNRFELYQRHAATQLFRKGARSVEPSERCAVVADVETLLKEIAGYMVRHHNFDVLEGDAFDAWKQTASFSEEKLKQLVQVDLVREYAFLDRIELDDLNAPANSVRRGIEWRHRSFLEYYAALSISNQWAADPAAVKNTLQDVHECLDDDGHFRTWPVADRVTGRVAKQFRNLPADWQWTLRFLLAATPEPDRSLIAMELMAMGNSFVVANLLQHDQLHLAERNVETLCRWLTQMDVMATEDSAAIPEGTTDLLQREQLQINSETARTAFADLRENSPDLTRRLWNLQTRDGSILYHLHALAPPAAAAWQQKTACREFALSSFLAEDRWVNIPEHPQVFLCDFPVTNAVYECFCASHHRCRDEFSWQDDQPAVYVSWFMATEFCRWLSAVAAAKYRLPTEVEWHATCQWGRPREWSYWWGPHMCAEDVCWCRGSTNTLCTRSRTMAMQATEKAETRHPSRLSGPELLDILGNVWEWCEDTYHVDHDGGAEDAFRVLRGGAWRFDGSGCGSSVRGSLSPGFRDDYVGFRVCRDADMSSPPLASCHPPT